MIARQILLLSFLATSASAFTVLPTNMQRTSVVSTNMNADSWNGPATGGGSIETIAFKIHPDGRVEETVRGVKGNNCHKITEDINSALGEVVASAPTEEMYEEEIVIDEKINLSDSSEGWEGSSSW